MATTARHSWGALDTVWHVAAQYLAVSGWPDVPTFVEQAIQPANAVDQPHQPGDDPALWQKIRDWGDVPAGRQVILPFAT